MTSETRAEGSAVGGCGDRLETLIGQSVLILCHLATGHTGMHSDGVTQWTNTADVAAEIAHLRHERTCYRNALWQLASDVNEVIDDMERGAAGIRSYCEQLRAAIVSAKPEFLL